MRFVKTAENLFGLPTGFQRVAYLESTGTQYIDTGYKFKTEVAQVKFGATVDTCVSDKSICGSCNIETDTNFGFVCYLYNNGLRIYLGSTNTGSNSSVIDGNYHTFDLTADNGSATKIIDGTTTSSSYNGSIISTGNFLLFTNYKVAVASYTTRCYSGKIYYFKIWDNGTLVRDFIPCIDSLGVACMYDLVGKKAYYNEGTGEFTVGRQIIPVEYLESTGTQWIDSGIIQKLSTELEVNCSFTDLNTGRYGCALGGPRFYFGVISSRWIAGINSNSYNHNIGTADTQRHIFKINKDGFFIDGVNIYTSGGTNPTNQNIALFTCLSGTDYNAFIAKSRCYNAKIRENGVLIMDFIPCKDENNVGFMFDTLSGTVYENKLTGAFVVGQNKYKMKLRLIRDNILPTGYTQVEYLESTGTQWIDTGINPENANTSQVDIETNFAILTPSSDQYIGIFGAAVPRFGFYTRYNNMCFGYYQAHDNVYEIEYGKKYNLKFNVTKGSQNATLDGVTVWSQTRTGVLASTYTIGLFCRNYSTPQWINNARIYNLTIAIDGTLVRNFIPALDPSGTPCVYDLVSRTPFYNAGTGTFITGNPVLPVVRFPVDPVPAGYKMVNYIESTGTQYIDTGFKANTTTTTYQTKILPTDVTTTQAVFGSRNVVNLANTSNCEIFIYQSAFRMDWVNGDGSRGLNVPITVNTPYEIEITRGRGVVNGVEYTSTEHTSATQNYNFLIGNFTNGSSSPYSTGFIGKIYYSRLYDNNALVRNFIPVIRLLDNKVGMWDTITKQFYGNAGTGDFITG